MHIHLRPRLARAADMLAGSAAVADIGSDHGRLAVALLQRYAVKRVIAGDISARSLGKASELAVHCGVADRVDLRVADGLCAITPGEADAIVMAGMGGLLMARILRDGEAVARSVRRVVLQPQGNAAELRSFLYENGYAIAREAIVLDSGRYYQLILAQSGAALPLPPGWPPNYLELGPAAYACRDPLLLPLAKKYRAGHEKRLERARMDGYEPALLLRALEDLNHIIAMLEDEP